MKGLGDFGGSSLTVHIREQMMVCDFAISPRAHSRAMDDEARHRECLYILTPAAVWVPKIGSFHKIYNRSTKNIHCMPISLDRSQHRFEASIRSPMNDVHLGRD